MTILKIKKISIYTKMTRLWFKDAGVTEIVFLCTIHLQGGRIILPDASWFSNLATFFFGRRQQFSSLRYIQLYHNAKRRKILRYGRPPCVICIYICHFWIKIIRGDHYAFSWREGGVRHASWFSKIRALSPRMIRGVVIVWAIPFGHKVLFSRKFFVANSFAGRQTKIN
jgi:hypothetical protein